MPSSTRTWFSSVSSLTIDFDFATTSTPLSLAIWRMIRFASSASAARWTVVPAASAAAMNWFRYLSRLSIASVFAAFIDARSSGKSTSDILPSRVCRQDCWNRVRFPESWLSASACS